MTFAIRTNNRQELLWVNGLTPNGAADDMVEWARSQQSVEVTPTGPYIRTRPFPTDEQTVYLIALTWANAESGGVESTEASFEVDWTFGGGSGTRVSY